MSIAYVLVGEVAVRGSIQVEPYFDPGEDPGAPNRTNADTPVPGTPTPRPAS
jgi:hypothetical protein